MGCPLGIYSFVNVVLTIDGRRIQGFAEGDDVITIEPNTDELGTVMAGADGCNLVSYSADSAAIMTIKMQPQAPINRVFEGKVKQILSGGRIIPFAVTFTDTSTGESGSATESVLLNRASMTHGRTATEREWRILLNNWNTNFINYNN